jgi:hypothetical protein
MMRACRVYSFCDSVPLDQFRRAFRASSIAPRSSCITTPFLFVSGKDQSALGHHLADQIVDGRKHFDGFPDELLQPKFMQDTHVMLSAPKRAANLDIFQAESIVTVRLRDPRCQIESTMPHCFETII